MLVADTAFRYIEHRERVARAVARGEERVGRKVGAFIRTRARTSLRRTGAKGRGKARRIRNGVVVRVQKTAKAGAPPIVRSRSKFATLKNIRFSYSRGDRVVYIGPVGIGKKLRGASEPTAAGLAERGGSATVEQWKPKSSNAWSMGKVRSQGTDSRTRRANYDKHPFMGPALDKEVAAGTIPDAWSGEVY